MKNLIAFLALFLSANIVLAQSIDALTWLKAEPGQWLAVEGDLADGQPMTDLSWAWNSSVACFPETQAEKFTGHHVLYAIDLPSYSEMDITLIPADKGANLSIYAYMVGRVTEDNLVPNLSRCVRCEVAHHSERPRVGRSTIGNQRVVRDILAIRNPYQVVIGITGANELTESAYILKIRVNKRK